MARPDMKRIRRRRHTDAGAGRASPTDEGDGFGDLTPEELTGVFGPPGWLRDLGTMSWLLVGVAVLLATAVALLSLTETIVMPVIAATIIAAVTSPLVRRMEGHRVPRAAGAALVFVALAVSGVALTAVVLAGITSQAGAIQGRLDDAATRLQGWLHDAGVGGDTAKAARDDAPSGVSAAFDALVHGLGAGITAFASVAVFASFTALSLFFLLKDGPAIRTWMERHLGLPPAVGRIVTGRSLQALRGYFAGVTVVAAFN